MFHLRATPGTRPPGFSPFVEPVQQTMEMLSRIKATLDCHAACGAFDRDSLLLVTANGIDLGHWNGFVTIHTLVTPPWHFP